MEQRILDYIVDYLRKNTYQPSIRDIGKRFGIRSTKTVAEYLEVLENKGYVEREGSRSRAVRVVGLDLAARPTVRVPFYGQIAAGEPALMDDHVSDRFEVDPRMAAASAESFFMRIDGESMKDLGILDGDMVLVDPVADDGVADGDVVAVRLGGEGTVKRYYRRGDSVVLEPANPDFPPMIVSDYDDFVVLGRVVGVFRGLVGQTAR